MCRCVRFLLPQCADMVEVGLQGHGFGFWSCGEDRGWGGKTEMWRQLKAGAKLPYQALTT